MIDSYGLGKEYGVTFSKVLSRDSSVGPNKFAERLNLHDRRRLEPETSIIHASHVNWRADFQCCHL